MQAVRVDRSFDFSQAFSSNQSFHCSPEDIRQFQEVGAIGPFPLLEAGQIESVCHSLRQAYNRHEFWNKVVSRAPLPAKPIRSRVWGKAKWKKGMFTTSRPTYELSISPKIVDRVESILGPNVIEWSSEFITQKPAQVLNWHVDAECLATCGLTIWIALENVKKSNSLKFISGSHNLPIHINLLRKHSGFTLDLKDDEAVLNAARECDPKCKMFQFDIKPGEFIIFSGKTWHTASNDTRQNRTAMIYQYSPARMNMNAPIPDVELFSTVNVPKQIPCCVVRGSDECRDNLIVPAPC